MLCVARLVEERWCHARRVCTWLGGYQVGDNFILPNAKRSKTATATTFPHLLGFLMEYFATVSNCCCVEALVCDVAKKAQRRGQPNVTNPTPQGLGIISQPIS